MDRKKEYKKLIKRAAEIFCENNSKGVELVWCDDCEEINLWTYWQGRNTLSVGNKTKLMVVGQDWGNPEENVQVMNNIKAMNEGNNTVSYLDNVKMFPTDLALIEIFASVLNKDINKNDNDLFFTNFCLGYRKGKQAGGMEYRQLAADNNKELFKKLVEIVQPDIIVPLGKITYEAVCDSLGIEISRNIKFNDLLDKQNENSLDLIYNNNNVSSKIIPMAHPGIFGQINRKSVNGKGLEQMKKDWAVVATTMQEL